MESKIKKAIIFLLLIIAVSSSADSLEIIRLKNSEIIFIKYPKYFIGYSYDESFENGLFDIWLGDMCHKGYKWTGAIYPQNCSYVPFRKIICKKN
jgi:hypothetical protein